MKTSSWEPPENLSNARDALSAYCTEHDLHTDFNEYEVENILNHRMSPAPPGQSPTYDSSFTGKVTWHSSHMGTHLQLDTCGLRPFILLGQADAIHTTPNPALPRT